MVRDNLITKLFPSTIFKQLMEFFSLNWYSEDFTVEKKNEEKKNEEKKNKKNTRQKQKQEQHHRTEIYTLNKKSEPCLIRIEDYQPYCYIRLPEKKGLKWSSGRLNELIRTLRKRRGRANAYLHGAVNGIETVKCRAIHGYLQGENYYLFCRFNNMEDMRKAKDVIEASEINFGPHALKLEVCEVDVEVVRKLTIERKLRFSDWFTCEAEEVFGEEKMSTFTHEYIASWKSLIPLDSEITKEWKVHPRLVAFDIECNSEDGIRFPNEFKFNCQCFAISLNYQQVGLPETRKKYSLILGDCAEPHDSIPYYCQDEVELINKFVELMDHLNADILSGYNIFGFDFKYLNGRLSLMWEDWLKAGSRIKGRLPTFIDESWTSSNTNKVNLEYVDFPGRISADVYGIVKTRERLPNYKLETISQKYLKQGKKDVTPTQLFAAYNKLNETRNLLEKCTGSVDERGRPKRHANVSRKVWRKLIRDYLHALKDFSKIIEYCNQDSELVVMLFEQLNLWETMIQFANVLQVRMKQVYTKGQQYKGFSQLYALLKEDNVIFNTTATEVRTEKYEGALNLGTKFKKVGMYTKVISGDVNSMYPSIILHNNLCVSTEISKEEAVNYNKDDYRHFEWLDCPGTNREFYYDLRFVKDHIHKGFIPRLVKKLLDERGEVKNEMKKVPEKSLAYAKLNSKQEALKVSANSLYGMLGTSKNPKVPSKHIAALVTKIGRDTLMQIVAFVKHGGDPNKPPVFPQGDVIYGDSVTKDTPIFIKRRDGTTQYVKIEDVPIDGSWEERGEKKMADPEVGLQVWSDQGFTQIKKIMKHYTNKRIFRIITGCGSVDVTEDHSLLLPNGQEVTPKDVHVGDELLHAELPNKGEVEAEEVIFNRHFFTDQLLAAYIARMIELQGLNYHLLYSNPVWAIVKAQGNFVYSIQQIIDLGPCNDYVYDLETKNHHFAAGIGKLVVHNTDSCQFIINREFKDNFDLIEFGEKYIEAINKFVFPLKLAFEKCGDMMLIGPKKYIFRMIDCAKLKPDKTVNERFGHWAGYKYTGVDPVKRNQSEITRRLYKRVCEHIMTDDYKGGELARLQDVVDMVFTDVAKTIYYKFKINDYLISESYNKESKTSTMSSLVGRMSRRGKPINLGERVNFILVNYAGERKDGKVGSKMRLPDDLDEGDKLDTMHYVEKMMTPIDALLCARYKDNKIYEEFIAHKHLTRKLGAVLQEKGLINKIPKNPDKAYMTIINNKFNSGNSAGRLELPETFTELVLFRNSEEYANVPKGVKMALTKAKNFGNKLGYSLLMKTPSLIENIMLADSELGVFEEYAKIMMSSNAFEAMISEINGLPGKS